MLNHLLLLIIALMVVLTGCRAENSSEAGKITFEDAFFLANAEKLPGRIFGDVAFLERASNGDLLLIAGMPHRIWLYVVGSGEWNELMPEDCHPGIETHIIGAAFSDEAIYLINGPSLSGHRYNRDGSCGESFMDAFRVPDSIYGLSSGFMAYVTDPETRAAVVARYSTRGEVMWSTPFDEHPNPAFSYNVPGGGMVITADSSAYLTTSSSPALFMVSLDSGLISYADDKLFNSLYSGVNVRFDAQRFRENPFIYLSGLGPHMIISDVALLANQVLAYQVPYMNTDEDDYLFLLDLKDFTQTYTRIPKSRTLFLSQNVLFEVIFHEEHMELRQYKLYDL